jgi:hypothetical protein
MVNQIKDQFTITKLAVVEDNDDLPLPSSPLDLPVQVEEKTDGLEEGNDDDVVVVVENADGPDDGSEGQNDVATESEGT